MPNDQWKLIVSDQNGYFQSVLNAVKEVNRTREREYKKVAARRNGKIPAPDNFFFDYLADIDHENERVKEILYRGLFLSIFMFTEKTLLDLSKHLQKECSQKFSVDDLKGMGITRSVNYINRVLAIDFPKDRNTREDFKIAAMVRNYLVHCDGVIFEAGKQEEFKNKIKKYNGKINLINKEIELAEAYLAVVMDMNVKLCEEISENWRGSGDPFMEE